ncbi:hypothetical protein SCARR_00762 [Pontiella sulfatireligans]|uniref:Uncharacterized protein n=1 Tax=Pontiella sulfatireligans TaxID=2750658 RepID=A0A6C2UFK9_9BACT|nr:hypothetical protein SCARR_00762 [Pontiella sulfatireligans]
MTMFMVIEFKVSILNGAFHILRLCRFSVFPTGAVADEQAVIPASIRCAG